MGTHWAIQAISCGHVCKPLEFLRVSYPPEQGILASFLWPVLNLFSACDGEGGTPVVPDNFSPGTVTGFSAAAGDTRISLSWGKSTDSEFTGDLILPRDNGVFPVAPAPLRSWESLWKGWGVVLWDELLFATPQSFTK